MNNEEKGNPLEPENISGTGSKPETAKLSEAGSEETTVAAPIAPETPEAMKAIEQPVNAGGSPSSSVEPAPRTEEVVPPNAVKPFLVKKQPSFLEEQPPPVIEMAPRVLRNQTRREILAFGIGVAAMATGAAYLLPQNTLNRLGVRRDMNSRGKEWLLNKALRIDDDVAEALYYEIEWCRPTPDLRLLRSRTTTTGPLLTLAIYRDGT